jgi:MFS family permease
MKNFLLVLLFIALTALCWGVYGPVLLNGQRAMSPSPDVHVYWRPFICVGLAYFVIAIVAPCILLRLRGERGAWTVSGTTWSLIAGTVTALGALGVILAFSSGGKPIYVMPLIFGCAPVVNTLYTLLSTKDHERPGPLFLAGLIIVAAGAVTVLVFKPAMVQAQHTAKIEKSVDADKPGVKAKETTTTTTRVSEAPGWNQTALALVFVSLTALCWGVYGPMLHKGQVLMQGSRLRPLICVGIAYFLIAVVVPVVKLQVSDEPGGFTSAGTMWSLLGGATGAVGALGVIMAFTFGGKPIYVMPLIFGCAPVINTFVVLAGKNLGEVSPLFYAGLILVITGAVTVLIFSPKAAHHPAAKPAHASSAAKQVAAT